MKLLLRRGQRRGLFHKVIYILDVRLHLSEPESKSLRRRGLQRMPLYERLELTDPGHGLLGLAFRQVFKAANLTLSVRDLLEGRRLEFGDVVEMLSTEDQIRDAVQVFAQVLGAADAFSGDEVLEL
jgi:hypothetical protein